MAVVSTQQILGDAFARRYGVAAFNVVNDLTLEAVIAAATARLGMSRRKRLSPMAYLPKFRSFSGEVEWSAKMNARLKRVSSVLIALSRPSLAFQPIAARSR